MTHIYFKNNDINIPESIKDRNGDVVLNLCKICGKAESELRENCEKVKN